MAAGHPRAADYAIGRLRDEAGIVESREGRRFALMGTVIQSATMTTGMGASQEAFEHYRKLVGMLNGD